MTRTPRRVIRLGGPDPLFAAALEEHDALALPADPDARHDFLVEHARDAEVAVVLGHHRVDADLLDDLPGLRAVVNRGVGYDHIDVAATAARGIAVSNTPDVLTECVADTAVGLMIDTMRRLPAADRFVRSGQWSNGPFPLTRQVSGSRVGILGLGRIGHAVARRLEGFGCSLAYHNRRPAEDVPYDYHPTAVSLAQQVDVLIVVTPGGRDTAALVDRRVLDALGPDGVLINIARGSVVDQDALVEALADGRLGGAGLDVFADEPHVPDALVAMDQVVLLPHIGSATTETRQAMADLTIANLESFLGTGRLVTPVPESPGA
jgi:lactate dehydrogenase-like 2-hydroxyacid dehydrogenase